MIPYLAGKVRHRSHEARVELFLRLVRLDAGAAVLDLGGSDGSFAARIAARRPDLSFAIADMADTRFIARDRYGFQEAALDPDEVLTEREWRSAALARQQEFAREIRRVGRSYFVQTPHPTFPVDPHAWLPFTSRLSHDQVRRLLRVTDRFWVKKCGVADCAPARREAHGTAVS